MSGERIASVPRGVSHVEAEAAEGALDRSGLNVRRPIDRVGDHPRQGATELLAARIVDVEDGRRAGRQHVEQAPLGLEVLLHVAVEVEVVPREIREDGRREAHEIDAMQRERVRRDLHRTRPAAAVPHLGEQPLHFRRLRRRVRGVLLVGDARAHAKAHRADVARRDLRGLEHRLQQVRGRRLAVRSGYADHREPLAGMAVEDRGQLGQRQARVGGLQPGHGDRLRRRRLRTRPRRAPRPTASAAKVTPSVRWPRIATNTAPAVAARESCTTAVTGSSGRRQRRTRRQAPASWPHRRARPASSEDPGVADAPLERELGRHSRLDGLAGRRLLGCDDPVAAQPDDEPRPVEGAQRLARAQARARPASPARRLPARPSAFLR